LRWPSLAGFGCPPRDLRARDQRIVESTDLILDALL
jgi:hypothetical protein